MNELTSKLNTNKPKNSLKSLKALNLLASLLLAAQAIVLIVIGHSDSGVRAVTNGFMTKDPLLSSGTGHNALVAAAHHMFDLNLVYVVAAFLLLAALAELLLATSLKKVYERDLLRGVNRLRWTLNGISIGLVFVAISMTLGILDFGTLLLIFGLGWLISLLGLSMEAVNQNAEKPYWLSYKLAGLSSLLVWVVLALTLWGDHTYGNGIPGYIYAIFFSMLVLFGMYAGIMRKQNQRKGKWADYLRAEKFYLVLGFVIESALAWQIYAGTLR